MLPGRARLVADPRARFAVMCLIWGVTWVPINIGVAEVPPLLFAGSRLFFAGVLTVIWCAWRGEIRFDRPVRLALVAFLTVTATYGPIFWGARFVSSGLGSVLNSSLTPVTLLVLSVAAGQERFSRRRAAAMLLGLVGLAILFRPSALGGASALLGAGAIALGTVAYCAGSVLARPLMRTCSPAWMLGATGFGGGATLVILSLLLEHHPHGVSFSAATWASWWFLLIFSSLLGMIIFFELLRDWGASRAGAYAFISPVISVLVGVVLLGETVTGVQAIGMLCLLVATTLAVFR